MFPMRHSLPQADALACSVSTPIIRSERAPEQLRQATPWSVKKDKDDPGEEAAAWKIVLGA
jgi:hypothetical protein